MNLSSLLFISLILFSTSLLAQSKVAGSLRDASGTGIQGAEVSLLNTRYKTFTDTAGKFLLTKIPSGQYIFHASIPGYAGISRIVNVSSDELELNLTWEPFGESLEEVIVNAEKTEAPSQRLPLSITAISGKKAEEYRIWTITDLTAISSNLYTAHPGDNRNVTSIRGIVNTSYDQAVVMYIDGVSQFNLDTYIPYLFDVERIEILKGPQGTVYGRNAMGGVINVVTKIPGNHTTVFAEANVGNYGQQRYTTGVRLPLLRDKLFLGAAGLYDKWDGIYTNEFNNSHYDKRKSTAGNYYLRYLPAASWSFIINAKHNSNRNNGPFPLVFGKEEAFSKPYFLNQNAITKMFDNTFNSSLSVRYGGASVIMNSLTAYQSNHRYYTTPIDADFSQLDALSIENNYGDEWNKVKVITQELNFSSAASSQLIKWLAGTYLFTQDNPVKQTTLFGEDAQMIGAPDKNFSLTNSSQAKGKGIALYGQLTFAITKKLSLIAGARYDKERRKHQVLGEYQKDPDPTPVFAYRPDTSATASFSSISPKVTLAFQPSENQTLYARYSKGFRAGGLTPLSTDPSQPALFTFKSETGNNFEAGLKGTYWNGKLFFNVAVFYAVVSNVQVPTLVLPDAVTITRNTGELKSRGIETEIRSVPFKGLSVDYSFGYTDAGYTKLKLSQNGSEKDLKGNRQLFTPDVTSMLAGQYSYRIGNKNGTVLVIRAEWKYLGTQYFDLANDIRQSSYHVLNTRFGISSKDLDLMFWARNFTDTRYISYAYDFGAIHLGDPKTYGFMLKVKF